MRIEIEREGNSMSEPFLSELKLISFNFAPKGWAFVMGSLLPINQNQALFFVAGTTYGGDGRVNFALPNLQGRVPSTWATDSFLGQLFGEANHTITSSETPTHTHFMGVSNQAADKNIATGNVMPVLHRMCIAMPLPTRMNPAGGHHSGRKPGACESTALLGAPIGLSACKAYSHRKTECRYEIRIRKREPLWLIICR